MRVVSTIFKILIWIVTIIYMFFQVAAIIGISMNNSAAVAKNSLDNVYNLIPLIIATVMMFCAVILFTVFKKRRYISILLAVIAAVAMLIIALDLGRNFPVTVSSTDTDTGLSTWKLIYRHIGIAIIPFMMLPAWLCGRAAEKAEQIARMRSGKSGYDLSGSAIFTDTEKNLVEPEKAHPLKRSLRKKLGKDK